MSLLQERRRRLAAQFAEHKIEAALISGLPNIRYLAGFTGSNALLLITPNSATLFTDPRYTIQAQEESDCKVVIAKRSLIPAAINSVRRRQIRRLGFEPGRMHVETLAHLERETRGLRFIGMPPLVEQLRMVKSEDEIAAIRQSVLTNSRAYGEALSRIDGNSTENEVAAEIEYWQRRCGAEGIAFESIVAAGVRSALPHARPTSEPIGTGRLLLLDIGALQLGYCSDMTRVVHLGTPGAKAKKLYRAVLESQLAAIDAVRPGVTAGQVDRVARKVLDRHGLAKAFVHSTGHGLGLEIHEPPRLGRNDKTRLEAGMVVTIEPGAYLEGFGGVRIEDTVLVTGHGCEILTPTPKELAVV
jgi:Xaa-Pro aminopeptidase